jgi:hypothetical protein
LRALSEDTISVSKAAELLDVGARELLASMNDPPPPSADDSPPGF